MLIVPVHNFSQDAKFGLAYPQYVELLASSAAVDEVVRSDLEHDRHRFMKNLIRGRRVGSQFPIRNHSEFESRIAEFERYEELEPLDRSQIIMELIKDASDHETHLDDICHLEQTFVEVADELETGFFVNLVSEALLTDFSVSTVTTTFKNDFRVDARDLVRHRYDHWEISDPYEDLQEHAYDTRNLGDWQRALAAVNDPDSSQFDHALADLFYWYTETIGAIPDEIKPRVYATAETLYRETDNTYMADAAEYQACLTEGLHQRENGSFENARREFFRANSISSEKAGPPFDEVKTFLESVLTDIAEYREQGKFMEAYEKAEYGHTELTEGSYQDADTEDEEILLDGWKHDMQAQYQRANGQFEEAIKTTNEAIADFRHVGADGLAQTAQTRRYQIQAIMAQLEPDFDKAANHHRSAREESTSGKTAHLHAVETDLCLVKKHLLDGEISEARERLDECDSNEPAINNLGVLIDVYDDYRQGSMTPTDAVIDRLDTSRSAESRVGRHIAYHGDYVSAVILVAASQRLKQQNVSASILDHITRVAIKNAISGGMSREWAEVTELSQIDTENIWRQLIPSVILKDIGMCLP